MPMLAPSLSSKNESTARAPSSILDAITIAILCTSASGVALLQQVVTYGFSRDTLRWQGPYRV